MIAKMTSQGKLIVYAEDQLEAYALRMFAKEHSKVEFPSLVLDWSLAKKDVLDWSLVKKDKEEESNVR